MYRSNLIPYTLKCILSNIGFVRTTTNASCNVVYKNNHFMKHLRPYTMGKYRRYDNNRKNKTMMQETRKFYLLAISLPTLFKYFFYDDDEDEKVSEIVMAIKRSVLLIEKLEFVKAEQMLHIALHQAQIVNHHDAITYIYDVMANLAFSSEDYHKAETLFVTVMQRLMSDGASENDMRIIHISLKLASVFVQLGEMTKAKLGYLFCIEHLQSYIEQDPQDKVALELQGMAFDWYGQMLMLQSKQSEAYEYFLRAYDISKKLYDDNHEITIHLLNELGATCYEQEKYDEAMHHLSAAIKIGKDLPDVDNFSSVYINLGNVFLKKGLYNEAEKSCKEGRKIAKKDYDKNALLEANECLKNVKRLLSL